jgi:hypothetical protein
MKPSNSEPHNELRPEDFPLGSPQSRAAARALLETRESGPKIILIVSCIGGTPDERLPTYEELQREWTDAGDRFVRDKRPGGGVILRDEIKKDSRDFRRVVELSSGAKR